MRTQTNDHWTTDLEAPLREIADFIRDMVGNESKVSPAHDTPPGRSCTNWVCKRAMPPVADIRMPEVDSYLQKSCEYKNTSKIQEQRVEQSKSHCEGRIGVRCDGNGWAESFLVAGKPHEQ